LIRTPDTVVLTSGDIGAVSWYRVVGRRDRWDREETRGLRLRSGQVERRRVVVNRQMLIGTGATGAVMVGIRSGERRCEPKANRWVNDRRFWRTLDGRSMNIFAYPRQEPGFVVVYFGVF
jgi:hypothetical protein